jgi:hypothetical protein
MSNLDIQTFQIGFPQNKYNDDMTSINYVIPVKPYKPKQTIIVFGVEKMTYKNKYQVYGVNIGSGHDNRHCAYIDLIADMTNPHHFDHLPSGSFDVLDSEHIPMEYCWHSPFFRIANRLLKIGGHLIFTMDDWSGEEINNHIVTQYFLRVPTLYGFSYVTGEKLSNVREHMNKSKNYGYGWNGICFYKTRDCTDSKNIFPKSIVSLNLPSFNVLMSRSTTFFEANMFYNATVYINTCKSNTYSVVEINQLQEKKRSLFNQIKDLLESKNVPNIPTMDRATQEPEELHTLLHACLYITKVLTLYEYNQIV